MLNIVNIIVSIVMSPFSTALLSGKHGRRLLRGHYAPSELLVGQSNGYHVAQPRSFLALPGPWCCSQISFNLLKVQEAQKFHDI